jgi:hypothetical protein
VSTGRFRRTRGKPARPDGGVASAALSAIGLIALAVPFCLAAKVVTNHAPPTVSCTGITGRVGSGHEGGNRVVLGTVSVPPAYLPQVGPSRNKAWPFFTKRGLAVRGGGPEVVVTVPKAWRRRVAITWGDSAIVSRLRIASCSAFLPPKVWNGYAGGFYLRSRSACVPLTFRVGRRAKTVRFGLGERC